MVDKIAKSNMLPRTISEVERDGWSFVAVTADNYYLFVEGNPNPRRVYKALSAQQMDDVGFRAIAEEEGIEVSEDGEIDFPQEMADKIAKSNMLPRTISEVERDGWSFVAVTADNHYLFAMQLP